MKALNTIETTLDIYFNSPSENGKGAGLGQEDERYITSSGDKFYIERDFYGKLVPFGFYDSMEDAIAARDILDSNGWDVSKVPESLFSWRFFIEYNPLTHSWEISNFIGGKILSFGLFKSIPIAKKALRILIDNNWDSSAVPLEYYIEDSNIRPFKRSKGTYYEVVRRIDYQLKNIRSFDSKEEAIEFRNSLFLNNWQLEEEEGQLFDNHIYIKGGKYSVVNNGEVFGTFDRICDASDFVKECVKNNWWNGDSYFT